MHIHAHAYKYVNSVPIQSLRSLRNLSMSSEIDSGMEVCSLPSGGIVGASHRASLGV